jgi:hypothetical protein
MDSLLPSTKGVARPPGVKHWKKNVWVWRPMQGSGFTPKDLAGMANWRCALLLLGPDSVVGSLSALFMGGPNGMVCVVVALAYLRRSLSNKGKEVVAKHAAAWAELVGVMAQTLRVMAGTSPAGKRKVAELADGEHASAQGQAALVRKSHARWSCTWCALACFGQRLAHAFIFRSRGIPCPPLLSLSCPHHCQFNPALTWRLPRILVSAQNCDTCGIISRLSYGMCWGGHVKPTVVVVVGNVGSNNGSVKGGTGAVSGAVSGTVLGTIDGVVS